MEVALPHYKGVTAHFAVNFCNQVFQYHTKNGGTTELTMEDAQALTSPNKSAAGEMISTDDPMIAKNCQDLLQQVLAEDSATWKAIRYLEKNKKLYPGFDFRVKYSSDGTPEGLIWITLNMREILLRYGDIICLICKPDSITLPASPTVPQLQLVVKNTMLKPLRLWLWKRVRKVIIGFYSHSTKWNHAGAHPT